MHNRLHKTLQYLLTLLRLSQSHLLRLLHRIAHSILPYQPQPPTPAPKRNPSPLPPTRPRALTAASSPLTTPATPSPPPTASPQHQSSLFHLPLEIRHLIYQHTLVSPLTHIVRLGPRLGHVRCLEPGQARPWAHRCWGISVNGSDLYHGPHDDFVVDEEKEEGEEEEEEMGEDKRRRRGRRGERGLLPLLLSCRKIYTEAITVLYGDNRFSLLHLESLISLQETILPRRLNAIRYLELGWYFYVPYPLYTRTTFQEARGPIREPMKQYPPYDIATWERVWAILAQMEGLTELRVDLVGRWIEPLTREEEGWLLEPAMAVRRPRVWEVRVDWEGVGVDWEARGAPFRVVRGGGSGGEGSERESGVWNA